jgi:flagellar operon protein
VTAPLHNPALIPPGGVGPAGAPQAPAGAPRTRAPEGPSFAEVLGRQTSGVQFSKHALQRVERRGIELDGPTLQRLDDGVARAAGKGARDAVVFVDGTAFVVAVKNRTVVTAVDAGHMREHVFTNIDSAVIA